MKAIRVHAFGGPEVLRFEEVPDPVPGSGQVVVALRAAGVNPVETYLRAGWYSPDQPLPFTPGWEGAGTIDSTGPEAGRWAPGARVWLSGSLSGTYAQKALCTVAQLHPLPEGVPFSQGAALGIAYATAWRALFQRAMALPGETVLVHGASGGVGSAAVQLAVAAGLTVVGTAGSERGRALVESLGAVAALDHGRPDYLDELPALTGGRGPDVIVELLANVNLARDLAVLAPRGRVVVVGSRGPVEILPRDLMRAEGALLGMRLPNATAAELASVHAALVAGLRTGAIRPVVGTELPLDEAARAHREIIEGKALGKMVLSI